MKFLDRYEVEFGRKTVIDLLASRQADYCPSNHTQRPYPMKINTFGNVPNFNGTVTELIEALNLKKDNQDIMFTMTLNGAVSMKGLQPEHGNAHVEFRAWTAPFRNFFSGHVNMDGAPKRTNLFELVGSPEEILEAVSPLIKDKVEWQTVNEDNRKVRLWLSRDLGH